MKEFSVAQQETESIWLCSSCDNRGIVKHSLSTHGASLVALLLKDHERTSPECKHPVFDLPGRPQAEWPGFANYLDVETRNLTAVKAQHGSVDPTRLLCIKRDIVWLDCQLGSDAQSVLIGRDIASFRTRLQELSS